MEVSCPSPRLKGPSECHPVCEEASACDPCSLPLLFLLSPSPCLLWFTTKFSSLAPCLGLTPRLLHLERPTCLLCLGPSTAPADLHRAALADPLVPPVSLSVSRLPPGPLFPPLSSPPCPRCLWPGRSPLYGVMSLFPVPRDGSRSLVAVLPEAAARGRQARLPMTAGGREVGRRDRGRADPGSPDRKLRARALRARPSRWPPAQPDAGPGRSGSPCGAGAGRRRRPSMRLARGCRAPGTTRGRGGRRPLRDADRQVSRASRTARPRPLRPARAALTRPAAAPSLGALVDPGRAGAGGGAQWVCPGRRGRGALRARGSPPAPGSCRRLRLLSSSLPGAPALKL